MPPAAARKLDLAEFRSRRTVVAWLWAGDLVVWAWVALALTRK